MNSYGFLHAHTLIGKHVVRRAHQNAVQGKALTLTPYCAETIGIHMVSFTFQYLDDDDANTVLIDYHEKCNSACRTFVENKAPDEFTPADLPDSNENLLSIILTATRDC